MDNRVNTVNLKTIFLLAGSFCAYFMGAGFATGQEIKQFYSSYGTISFVGLIISAVVFVYFGYSLYSLGFKMQFKNPYDVYRYYCGKYVGTFYEWYSVVLIYLVAVVVLAGAGAALNQYFGVPTWVGIVVIGIFAIAAVLMGLNRLISIMGILGPVVILILLIIAIGAIVKNPGGILQADSIVSNLEMKHASSHWWLSGLLYPGLCLGIGCPFLLSCGATAANEKEAKAAGITAPLMFVIPIAIILLSQLSYISDIADAQVPVLVIAQKFMPVIAALFLPILLIKIFITVTMVLWTFVRRFAEDKTKKFKIITIIAGCASLTSSFVPFDVLVNILYPLCGYFALVFIVFMIIKQVKDRTGNSEQNDAEEKAVPPLN